MAAKGRSSCNTKTANIEDEMELKRGPWTVEEDFKLINYIATHGEGRWNSLARCAGLKRTGKSCRLRWLNYLRPDVRRGNISLKEQLLILELHSRWGNRWSKIAQYLPGRTDNEIKNYWRTRVQKHAKQLKCDVNSKQFKDTMRYLWMPRLVERIQAATAANPTTSSSATSSLDPSTVADPPYGINTIENDSTHYGNLVNSYSGAPIHNILSSVPNNYTSTENSSLAVSPASDLTEYYNVPVDNCPNRNPNPDPDPYYFQDEVGPVEYNYSENFIGPPSDNYFNYNGLNDFQDVEQSSNLWFDAGDSSDSLWNVGQDFWFCQQQLNNGSM